MEAPRLLRSLSTPYIQDMLREAENALRSLPTLELSEPQRNQRHASLVDGISMLRMALAERA